MVKVAEFLVEDDEGLVVTDEPEYVQPTVVEQEPVIVTPSSKNVRVKGTWTMQWGPEKFDFVDGRRYEIPLDLFNFLKNRGCIYDTM